MKRYMLDTNTVCDVIKGHPPQIRKRLMALPLSDVVLSTVTQAELLYWLARKGHPVALALGVRELLLQLTVLPWDEQATTVYGDIRALRFVRSDAGIARHDDCSSRYCSQHHSGDP